MNFNIKKIAKQFAAFSLAFGLMTSGACKKVDVPSSKATHKDSAESSVDEVSDSQNSSESSNSKSSKSDKISETETGDNQQETTLNSSIETEESSSEVEVAKRAKVPAESTFKAESYFADSLFIGDSRAQSLMLYGTLLDADFIVSRGYNAPKYFNESIPINEGQAVGKDFVEQNKGSYKDIYIMLGTNELGYPIDSFIANYSEVLQHVKANNPKANIYVCAIVQVTREKNSSDDYVNNTMIKDFNARLNALAAEEDVWFLDPTSVIVDEEGYLPSEVSADGVHFDRATVAAWQEFIQKHVA